MSDTRLATIRKGILAHTRTVYSQPAQIVNEFGAYPVPVGERGPDRQVPDTLAGRNALAALDSLEADLRSCPSCRAALPGSDAA